MSIAESLSPAAREHLESVRRFYDRPRRHGLLSARYAALVAARYRLMVHPSDRVLEVGCGRGDLLACLPGASRHGIDLCEGLVEEGRRRHPGLVLQAGPAETFDFAGQVFDTIILSDVLNEVADVELVLSRLASCSHPGTRLLINIHNTLWRPALGAGRRLGLARPVPPGNWLSRQDVINLCALADWEAFKSFGQIVAPLPLGPASRFLNRWCAPLANWACLALFLVARRRPAARREPGVVSVLVPARNEAGNIDSLLQRIPRLGRETEVILVEGHSADDTWKRIEALPDTFAGGRVVKLRQSGEGKGNAVVEGFRLATGDILTILDADLTMPPEDLPKYVEVLASGKADFANGVRLVYPMGNRAMPLANLFANKFFSAGFSWLLGQPVKDTLCGTKALWRDDYWRLDANRSFFGDFDPFGDFDLLFGADKLNLKIMDVPIRYGGRCYGSTNIRRWTHGAILLRMLVFAARRLKFV